MKALAKIKPEKGLWMVDVPEPKIGPNDLIIEVVKTAICGTDLHIYQWNRWAQQTIPVPMVTGHEFVGRVIEMGSEVEGFEIGDRVTGEGHLTCGHCRNCRAGKRHLCRNTQGIGVNLPGCFSERFALPSSNAFKLDDNINDDTASLFDPLGNAVHTALSFDLVGEDVLITGAGPIGIMAALVAQYIGARYVLLTDLNAYRLELAKKAGVRLTVNIRDKKIEQIMSELHMLEGFDVGLEMSGNPKAQDDMFRLMNNGGKVALLGLPDDKSWVDWNQIIFKGLELKGIYGREMFETWYKMAALVRSGFTPEEVITHHFPIDDFESAFLLMSEGKTGKVILDWT